MAEHVHEEDLEHLPLRGEEVFVCRRSFEEVVSRICCHVPRNIFCQGERDGVGGERTQMEAR